MGECGFGLLMHGIDWRGICIISVCARCCEREERGCHCGTVAKVARERRLGGSGLEKRCMAWIGKNCAYYGRCAWISCCWSSCMSYCLVRKTIGIDGIQKRGMNKCRSREGCIDIS